MTKGAQGQTCAEALRSALKAGEVLESSDLFQRVRSAGSWADSTIWQHMMACLVNLPPAREHWPNVKPFLFLHEDGRYELYDPAVHPRQD